MSNYGIGDRVIVRHDLKCGGKAPSVIHDMLRYRGQVMTIFKVTPSGWYKFKEDANYYSWSDYMIEGLALDIDIKSFEDFLLE